MRSFMRAVSPPVPWARRDGTDSGEVWPMARDAHSNEIPAPAMIRFKLMMNSRWG
jgi:hypothetical protein